jgi:hypothetical protein
MGGEKRWIKLTGTGCVGSSQSRGKVGFILNKEAVDRAGLEGVQIAATV